MKKVRDSVRIKFFVSAVIVGRFVRPPSGAGMVFSFCHTLF